VSPSPFDPNELEQEGPTMRFATLVPWLAALGGLALSGSLSAQCEQPQGNATLAVSGLPEIGGSLTVTVDGTPLSPFVLAASIDDTSVQVMGRTLCLGFDPFLVVNGLTAPLIIPATGTFSSSLGIPLDPTLAGWDFYFQALVLDLTTPEPFEVSNLFEVPVVDALPVDTIWYEDFETGWGNWYASNGVWEVGTPTAGPGSTPSGTQCAGTLLDANYPASGANTRLVSPGFVLPTVDGDEAIRLNWRQWFDTEDSNDYVKLQVSTDGGLNWTDAPNANTSSGWNKVWVQAGSDLTPYAGQYVQLGFYFSSSTCWGCSSVSGAGVFIDDLHVFTGTPLVSMPEDFENGIGFWWRAANGLWEVGTPTVGPPSTPSGTSCAGLWLDGNYPARGTNASLVSAPFTLSSVPQTLYFQQWFSTEDVNDTGYVQVWDGTAWNTVAGPYSGVGTTWTQAAAPLAAYAGQTIQIRFYFTSSTCWGCSSVAGPGWYVDDLRIQ
jgi:hypothetical protein